MSNWLVKRLSGIAAGAMLLLVSLTVAAAPSGETQAAWRPARGAARGGSGKAAPQVRAEQRRAAKGGGRLQVLTYRFAHPVLRTDADGISEVVVPGTESGGQTGAPRLPALGVRVAIPQGETLVAVRIVPGAAQQLAENIRIRHVERPYPLSRPELAGAATPRNPAIYESNARYPAHPGVARGARSKRGVAFEELVLHPVAYEPASGRIYWHEEIAVEVETKPVSRARGQGAAFRARLRSARDAEAALPLVDNPGVLAGYAAEPPAAADTASLLAAPAGAAPAALADPPSLVNLPRPALPCSAETNRFRHLTVTVEELRPAFVQLAQLRRSQGLSATVVTMEDLLPFYSGRDAAESLREFIRDAYQNWGVEYVVLGGDSTRIPARLLWVEAFPGEADTMPSDLYFQCLDGTFNSDNDALWGEPTDGPDGGDIDLYAEVAIGRVSAETEAEAGYWLQKVLTYEADRAAVERPGYLSGGLIIGEHLGFGGISEYATEMMEQIRLGSSADGYTTEGFAPFDIYTQVDTLYDSPENTWTTEDLATRFNADTYAVMNHLGHCSTDYCMRFTNADADSLLHNTKPAFLYTQGCIAGAFDRDCIAEHFTTSGSYGLFGGVLNARYGWGSRDSTDGPSQRYARRFWDVFFNDFIAETGIANQYAHERNAPLIYEDCMRWCYYESNLFGDPAQALDGFSPMRIELDREAYRSDASAVVRVLATPREAAGGTVTVTAVMTAPDGVTVLGSNAVDCAMADFIGRRLSYTSAPVVLSTLGAVHGARLTVFWAPAAGTERVQDSARIDDLPPVISGVRAASRDDGEITVAWATDEPAIGGTRLGTTLPPDAYAREHDTFTTNHAEVFSGLPPFTRFHVAVWAADLAGNPAYWPANTNSLLPGDYANAATLGREVLIQYDMERGDDGWTVGNITNGACWQRGSPSYGPLHASRCWGTILDGRYPDGANATLTSPPVQVRGTPVILFRHWFDIETTPPDQVALLNADCGYLEVMSRGAWHNVGAYAQAIGEDGLVSGSSSGAWQQVRIALPETFANQPLQLRFRFVSDQFKAGHGNPAGWYVDDVRFTDMPLAGIGIADCRVDDSAGGNGDGAATPGENIRIQLRTFNYTGAPVAIREGSFVLLTGGLPSSLVQLLPVSPAAVGYGTIPALDFRDSAWYEVAISPAVPPGTVVTVLQTLIGTDGRIYENRGGFTVRTLGPLAGRVVTLSGEAGVSNATVTAAEADEIFMTQTDANGDFAFDATSSGTVYRVTARLGAVSAFVMAAAPANGLLLRLGLPRLELAPTQLAFAAPQGGRDGGAFTLGNAADATAPLDYALSVVYLEGRGGWLAVTNGAPLVGSLAPGQSLDFHLLADAAAIPPGTYRARVDIASNDSDDLPDAVDATFEVADVLMLAVQSVRVDDAAGGDGDGHLEAGETGEVFVTLLNSNRYSGVVGLTGTVAVDTPAAGATVAGGNPLAWPYLTPGGVGESVGTVAVSFTPGAAPQVWFSLTGADTLMRPFALRFALTNDPRHSVEGRIETTTRLPLYPPGQVSPVVGAVVTAEAPDGSVFRSQPSDANGVYRLDGLRDAHYWFRLEPVLETPHVPPAGQDVHVDPGLLVAGSYPLDFMTDNFGTNSAHLHLADVVVDDTVLGDGDGAVDPGETLLVWPRFYNEGWVSALATTGSLVNAVMDRPDCMTVLDGVVGQTATILARATQTLAAPFVVQVAPGAAAGDFQRFWVTAAITNSPLLAWPFDFRLDVAPRHSITGVVSFADGNNTAAAFAEVRVTATNTLGEVFAATPGSDGAYRFALLTPDLVYGVMLTRVPAGYARPGAQTLLLDADKRVDFLIGGSGYSVTPPGFDLVLPEGVSTGVTLTVQNTGTVSRLLAARIGYTRTLADVRPGFGEALAAVVAAAPADWTQLDAASYSTEEIEIRFQDGTPMTERLAYLDRHGLRAVFHYTRIPALLARPADSGPIAALGGPAALADPVVAYVQPATSIALASLPSDPLFGQLWNLRNVRQTGGTLGADIGAEAAWNVTTGSEEVVVAVFDTGILLEHEDLADNLWRNPIERPGDANGDGAPGELGIDDDGDAESQMRHRDPYTGQWRHEIPGNRIDDDGDGIIDETGVDFDDEDVMLADYDQDGQPHVVRGWSMNWRAGTNEYYEVIDPEDRILAAHDDDENGYVDDLRGWCFGDWDADVNEHQYHGTHVAGIIGAVGGNGYGIAGVNWKVKLMPISLMNAGEKALTTSARIVKAMEYAMDQGARISCHSWLNYPANEVGLSVGSGVMLEMMRSGMEANHLFVTAAGNEARDLDVIPSYPAAYAKVLPNVVAVAASDHDGRLASFSSFGDESVLLAAPGVEILSTVPDQTRPDGGPGEPGRLLPGFGTYARMSGTSVAAPHAAGAAALLWSLAPDAGYEVIVEALEQGARRDPGLEGWVKSGGHLDVGRSVQALNRLWLRFDGAAGGGQQTNHLLGAGQTVAFALLVNAPPALRAGQYTAAIRLSDDAADLDVPVSLTVEPATLAVVADAAVSGDTDGDGLPEPGETAFLAVTLRNDGSAAFENLEAELVGVAPAGVTAASNTCSYGYVFGNGFTALPDRPFHVILPPAPATNALFNLVLRDNGAVVATLPVNLALTTRHALRGRVVLARDGATPVAGARIEVVGTLGASAVTGADGRFVAGGLPDGDYTLRILPVAEARPAPVAVGGLAGDRDLGDLPVAFPETFLVLGGTAFAAGDSPSLRVAVQQGMASNVVLVVSNAQAAAADAHAFQVVGAPRRRLALISDGTTLGTLRAPLLQMGFEVDSYTNNFRIIHYFNPRTGLNEVLQYVAYTWDDALFSRYAFVIADVSGPEGQGRPFSADEAQAFRAYLERGGRVLFTGVNPLSRPDNEPLAALLGLGTNASDRVAAPEGQAMLQETVAGVFASLTNGTRLATAAQDYDLAAPALLGSATAVATAGPAAKVVRHPVGTEGGTAWFWSGNPDDADWRDEGAWQDLLRNLLWDALVANAPVSWLGTLPDAGTAGTVPLTVALNGGRQALPGCYAATLHLFGNGNAEEVRAVPVELTVTPPALRVHNSSGQVVDWRGVPLAGDGGERACLFQILYAGTNGVPDAPGADGAPGGDDQLLTGFVTGQAFGRFGVGFEQTPDQGRFDTVFAHTFAPGSTGIVLYARAWDAATFDAAMAYGDSTVRHTLAFAPDESADFGSWSVTNTVSVFRDSNGDGLPDTWTQRFRPDLDPRAAPAALAPVAATTPTNRIASLAAPARLVVTTNFLFIAESGGNRLSVYSNRAVNLPKRLAVVGRDDKGTAGSLNGQFHTPSGIAADPRPGQNWFAVADQDNHRVQCFAFSPLNGSVSHLRTFGSQSGAASPTAPDGTFSGPRAVAVTGNGFIQVADTGNQRLQLFTEAGGWISTALTSNDAQTQPEGIEAAVRDGIPGAWVADAYAEKHRVAFYALPGSVPGGYAPPKQIIEQMIIGETTNVLNYPADVQVWQVGARQRLCVVDRNRSVLRILGMDGALLMDVGDKEDDTLQEFEKLFLPYGVTPVDDSRRLYVADQGNNRVVWYDVQLDADGDGMDDIWEDLNGLDSTSPEDAFGDADNDGLPNIGESLARTDPRRADTDGDGGGDLYEMVNLRDPLTADLPGFDPARLLAIAASQTVVGTGGVVTITATYDQAPTNAVTAFFFAADGSGMGSLPMAADGSGTNFTCGFQPSAGEAGWVDVRIRSLDQDPPEVTSNDLFYITSGTVWVPYPIADIRMTGFAPPRIDIFWNDAAKPPVGATETYRIVHTVSLTAPDWQPISEVQRTRPFGVTSFGVFPITDAFLDPHHNFFRLFRAE